MDFSTKWKNNSSLDFDLPDEEENELLLGQLDFSIKWSNNPSLDFDLSDNDTDITIDMVGNTLLLGPISNAIVGHIVQIQAGSLTGSPISMGLVNSMVDAEEINLSIESQYTSTGELWNDINVIRGIRNVTSSFHEVSGDKLRSEIKTKFEDSPYLAYKKVVPINEGDKIEREISVLNGKFNKGHIQTSFTVEDGDQLSNDLNTINKDFDNVNKAVHFISDIGDYISSGLTSNYIFLPRSDCEKSNKWMEADRLRREWADQFEDGIAYRYDKKSYFEDGVQPIGYRPTIIKPVEPIKPEIAPPLNFLSLWDSSSVLDFLRIELDALIVMNEISIYHIADDGTKSAIHPVSASLELDIDSQVWSFKGQLFGADSLTWLTYRANFEINVNGHQLLFVLREYSRASSFASDAYTFTAVTNTQWLFSPYANLYSGAVENETGAWQIVEEILTQESFTLNRALTPEWILAPDSFSYLNKTPIEMAIQAAQASGAILQPNKTGNSLDVQPRYKVSPWNWNTLTDEQCDHVINADYVITESSSDNTTTEINRVLISGETHGVITDVVKSGTAGDVRGSDVVSNLSQDHNVNMELARNMMGDSGDQEILGLSLPLLSPDSDFGLLLPGEIVRIVYTDKSITGLCLSNSIPIQSITDVSQSVKLELNNGYR